MFCWHRCDKRRRRLVEAAAADAAAATSRRHRRQVLLRRSNRCGLVQGRRVLRRARSRVGAPRLHAKAAWSGRSPRIQPDGSGERYVSFYLRMGNLCDIDDVVFCSQGLSTEIYEFTPPGVLVGDFLRGPHDCQAVPHGRCVVTMRRHRARRYARLWPRRG